MRVTAAIFTLFVATASAATPAQWRARSIYQVLTDRFARSDGSTTAPCDVRSYCGGTWQGITTHLDYIQGMGFDAIWISPITANLPQRTEYGEAYHGYWQQDLFELNSRFGTADDLKALARALHSRGMYLMVDVVVNHYGFAGPGNAVDYSQLRPFGRKEAFHSFCSITNYENQTDVEDCWLGDASVSLPDLKTEDPAVAETFYSWISDLVSNYSIDGLRIDTVKHVPKNFWPRFNSAAGVYSVGEVFDGSPAYTCDYQNYLDGVLNYPIYYPLLRAFQTTRGNIGDLVNGINTVKDGCKDSTLLGTFIENHDIARFPSFTDDLALAKNVMAFVILSDGIPIIYEGQEQHYSGNSDPVNREAIWLSGYSRTSELYGFLGSVNRIRKQAISRSADYLTYKNYPIYSDSTTIAMRKGFDGNQVITVLSNLGANGPSYTFSLGNTGYTAGQVVVEVLSCTQVTADGNGNIVVSMGAGLPKVFYPLSQLTGSGICGR